jgi:antirestriction protein ArdC
MTKERADIYANITNDIVTAIEAGAGTYTMPWHHDGSATSRPTNVVSAKAYRGANVIMLWLAARQAGYSSGLWGTYRQWAQLGGQVRKGERATSIVFWKINRSDKGDQEADEPGGDRLSFFARGYSVFNMAQVDGYEAPVMPALPESERLAAAEIFYANLRIPTIYGGCEAFYRPSEDRVHMPPFEAFHDGASHYSVLLHEAVHATAAPHRCDRDLSARFGSEAYGFEEVIADLGSAMLLADLGIAMRPRPDHAAYIASWLKVLKNDRSAIFTAASKAQAAADWMHAQQPSTAASAAA